MRNTLVIAKRELRGFFDQPVAYIVVVAFLAIAGWMFFQPLFLVGVADMRPFFQPGPFSPSMLLVILAPAVTMRLVAEERKSGTIELLTTLPVTSTEVILGKFLGAAGLLLTALASTGIYAVFIKALGDLDLGATLAGYVGLALFSLSLVAVGLLMSSLTQNQIVAFILGFVVCAALYFVNFLTFFLPQGTATLFQWVSVSYHLDNLARGVIDTRDILYYLSLTGGALFLAVQALKRQHA